MEHTEDLVEDVREYGARVVVAGPETHLGKLDVPVGELPPDEVVQDVFDLADLPVLHEGVDARRGLFGAGEDPAVFRVRARRGRLAAGGLEGAEHEPGYVPQLVGEVAGGLEPALAQAGVVAGRRAGCDSEPEGVGAVVADGFERVDDVALGLAHLHAVLVPHQTGEVDGVERHVVHVFEAHHHHAGDPEEQDVVGSLEHGAGVEVGEVLGLLRPAQRGVRPQRRREPGVEDILVLREVPRAARAARRGVVDGDGLAPARAAVPHGYAMAPPELAGDAPVADVLHPVGVDALEAVGDDCGPSLADGGEGPFRQRRDAHEPLLADDRLDDVVAALAVADGMDVRLDFLDQALGLELRDDGLARVEAIVSLVRPRVGVQGAVGVEDVHGGQTMPRARLEVVGVVSRGDLESARAELHRDCFVLDDGDGAAQDG